MCFFEVSASPTIETQRGPEGPPLFSLLSTRLRQPRKTRITENF